MRLLTAFAVLAIAALEPASAQEDQARTPEPAKLPVSTTLPDAAQIYAVAMPPQSVEKIFGKAVARNYVVIQVTVANKSKQSSLLIQDLSLDYNKWILGNCLPPAKSPVSAKSPGVPAALQSQMGLTNTTNPSNGFLTKPCQVSSQEVRAVRQLAVRGQSASWRNKTLRYLQGIGTVGAGLGVANLGPALPQAVAAFSGSAIPAFELAFPDYTIDQIGLLDDLAYRINSVVPTDSARIVMAFFPIKRFLGEYFYRYYQIAPALFFSPVQYFLDPKYKEFFENVKKAASRYYQFRLQLNGLLQLASLPSSTQFETIRKLEDLQNANQETRDKAWKAVTKLVEAAEPAFPLAAVPAELRILLAPLVKDLVGGDATKQAKATRKIQRLLPALLSLGEIMDRLPPDVKFWLAVQLQRFIEVDSAAAEVLLIEELLKAFPSASSQEKLAALLSQTAKASDAQESGDVETGDDSIRSLDISHPDFTLNAIRVIVEGQFITDTRGVPPQLSAVQVATGSFLEAGVVAGYLTGQFLMGAVPTIANGDDLRLKIDRVEEGSSDTKLNFRITTPGPIASGTMLRVSVERAYEGGRLISNTRELVVRHDFLPVPKIKAAAIDVSAGATSVHKLKITGENFYKVRADKPLQVVLTKGESIVVVKGTQVSGTTTEITATLPQGIETGKWAVVVRTVASSVEPVEVEVPGPGSPAPAAPKAEEPKAAPSKSEPSKAQPLKPPK